ncbi:MAG: hypothetical protein ACK2T2_06550 [Anaerolineales bacterium]
MKASMIRYAAAVLVLSFTLFGIHACSPDAEGVAIEHVDEWLKAVEALPHGSAASRCSVDLVGSVKDSDDFDPNEYFRVFGHLSMEPGYTLDSVMLADPAGRRPIVYVREVDELSFTKLPPVCPGEWQRAAVLLRADCWIRSIPRPSAGRRQPARLLPVCGAVVVDDQYQLYWHGLYNDTTILTSKEETRGFFQAAAQGLGASPDEASLKAGNPFNALLSTIDSTPWVRINDGEAEVRLITFSKWGGFYELRITLSFDFPHAELDSRSRLRFPYNCGVLY